MVRYLKWKSRSLKMGYHTNGCVRKSKSVSVKSAYFSYDLISLYAPTLWYIGAHR